MRKSLKILPVFLMLFLVGCDHMTHTEQNVLGGAAIGAVGGALIGRNVGGAAIGAGVGALGGYIYDRSVYGDYY
ncbi:MAG: hypothetical protein JSS07_09155 [Proteobacteria bacterium]|nr:hypothetical protein [Pseudomonadota bacterium]